MAARYLVASGPQHLRHELRRHTERLHALRRALVANTRPRLPLPTVLFDGGLTPLLSERLRALLASNAPGPGPEQRVARQRHDTPVALPSTSRDLTHQSGLVATRDPAWKTGAGAHNGTPPGTHATNERGLNGSRPLQPHTISAPPHTVTAPSSDERDITGIQRATHAPPTVPAAHRVVPTLLETQLREYWKRASPQSDHARANASWPAAIAELDSGHTARSNETPHSARAAAWPEQTGRAASQRIMNGLASMTSLPHDLSWSDAHTTGGGVHIRNEFHVTVGAQDDDVTLGDRLAELLREQALQHGIDLT